MKKARELILKVFNLLMKPEMRILPGHLAFYLVMTIIPLLALLVTLAAALSISTDTIRMTLADTIPAEVLSILDVIVAAISFICYLCTKKCETWITLSSLPLNLILHNG